MSFWDFILLLFIGYLLVAYVMFLVQIVGDLFFGAHALSGWSKALWFVALLILPLVTAFAYLIARSRGMGTGESPADPSSSPAVPGLQQPTSASQTPADQIAAASALLAAEAITQSEFDWIKAKALA